MKTAFFGQCLLVVVACCILPQSGESQVVQLPNQRNFSLQGGAYVPDGGSASLGGIHSGGDYNTQRPGVTAGSSLRGAAGASVHATVIDLNELDRMIRSQVEDRPKPLRLPFEEPSRTLALPPSIKRNYTVKDAPAPYDYMVTMSHGVDTATETSAKGNLEEARHYLQVADRAAMRKEWSSAAYFYNLAWENLPEARRTQAMKDLLEARAVRIAAKKELANKKSAATPQQ